MSRGPLTGDGSDRYRVVWWDPEDCVASAVTPSGGRPAGRYDLGVLCVAAEPEAEQASRASGNGRAARP